MKNKLAFLICSVLFSFNLWAGQTCSGKKILLCHKEGKSLKDANEICVDISAIDGHLKNHPLDTVGSCDRFDPALIKTYACNAGLKYNVNLDRQCVRHDQGEIIANDCGDSTNCTCSENPQSQSAYLLNSIKYSISDYDDDLTNLSFVNKVQVASNTNTFSEAATALGANILKSESALQFQLGSERYGAEYFVDLCIRNDNANPDLTPLALSGNILYAGGFFSNQTYPQASKLFHKLNIYCDDQIDGDFHLSQLPSFSQTEIPFYFGKRTFETEIPGRRFCVVRHSFRETQNSNLRENSAKKATFQTNLSVEGSGIGVGSGAAINFCKIEELAKKTYACTSINFPDTDTFRNFIISTYGSGHSSAFQNDFKDIYNGTCPNPCGP